ncbi:MAG: hypothetical protein DMG05_05675 [Acidobacteria bacterium]|nr:MAG: hypothetical protein DMG05_05675 [Acidobacteriota bacterium]
MNKDKQELYKQILINKRKELYSKVQKWPIQATIYSEDSEGDIYDLCVQSLLKDQFLSLCERERKTLEMVEEALERIQTEVYGLCEECQEPINEKRLKALAWVKLCINCQSQKEGDSTAQATEDCARR